MDKGSDTVDDAMRMVLHVRETEEMVRLRDENKRINKELSDMRE